MMVFDATLILLFAGYIIGIIMAYKFGFYKGKSQTPPTLDVTIYPTGHNPESVARLVA